MANCSPFTEFVAALKIFVVQHPDLTRQMLGNTLTMRRVGAKTHGDLFEIAMAEFINQYLDGYSAKHVGKDRYRSKSQEEDIAIRQDATGTECLVSLKAYGVGPLQISTDKAAGMYSRLERTGDGVAEPAEVGKLLAEDCFTALRTNNVLALIYDEEKRLCKLLVSDNGRALRETKVIRRVAPSGNRKHPVYHFVDSAGGYICEVRYGDAKANALQRGLWANTRTGTRYFDSLTDGWVEYSDSTDLEKLFGLALVSSGAGQAAALAEVNKDIARLKEQLGSST